MQKAQIYFTCIASLSLLVGLFYFKFEITETVNKISRHFSEVQLKPSKNSDFSGDVSEISKDNVENENIKGIFDNIIAKIKNTWPLNDRQSTAVFTGTTAVDTVNVNAEKSLDGTTRPDECLDCFKTQFRTMINEPKLCNSSVDLLILITSTIPNLDYRNVIRSTWCNLCKQQDSGIKCLFVFGNRNNAEENSKLIEESKLHHDIIQVDFYDIYANLTYKTISALQWSKDYCHQATFVMKTDDDMYVNTELLQTFVKVAPNTKLIGGHCWGPQSPHREVTSKWHVSFRQYRQSLFPSVCSGTGYIMSRDVVTEILRQSSNVPYFHLEDVYVAICVQRIGIRPKLIAGFSNMLVDFNACRYRNRIFTSHGLNADTLQYMWKQIQNCPNENISPSELYKATDV